MAHKQKRFQALTLLCAMVAPLVMVSMFFSLSSSFYPAWQENGLSFFTSSQWDPLNKKYGVLVFLTGTFITTIIALTFSTPFSICIAILTGEILSKKSFSRIISTFIEIIAAIPSVVLGLWGIVVIVPVMQTLQSWLGYTPFGIGLLTACLVLGFMIIPFAATLSREVILLVPKDVKEAAYALGATQMEVILKVIIPYARTGIIGGLLLSAGRAIGETMVVAMLIGNANHFISNIFSPTNTMASIIANEFAEADEASYYSALLGVGLTLLISTLLFSLLGRYILKKSVL